jgi:HSP20 family protein
MAEEESKEVKKSTEKGKDIKVGKSGGGRALSPFEEMDRMMESMKALFEDYFPYRWRGGRFPTSFEDMERMFEGFRPGGWLRHWRHEFPHWEGLMPFEGRAPKVDVIDRDEEVVIHAELPGVDKDDLDVSLTGNTVTIKGTSAHEEKEEKGDYYRREMSRGEFSRTVSLPCEVDDSKAKATFKDGVMELVLPKVEPTKRRSIKVK